MGDTTNTSRRRPTVPSDGWRPLRGWLRRGQRGLVGALRPFGPGARGVYHPQPLSRVVLGVALPRDTDVEAIGQRLWWRGLGIVEREDEIIAGADVTEAATQRRMKAARAFVTRQLRDACVRGRVRRWERDS